MDWVLNNLDNVIIPIIIMILYGMGSFAQKKGNKGKKVPPPQAKQADPEESRRVAQIQEEIRRKIAERTGRVPPPPQKRPPTSSPTVQTSKPAMDRGNWSQPMQKRPEPSRRATPPPITPKALQIEQQQREIEVKLKQARDWEARLKSMPPPAEAWGSRERRDTPKGDLRKMLFQDLANPLGQKKAILVGEILGTPVGVKGPAGWNSKV